MFDDVLKMISQGTTFKVNDVEFIIINQTGWVKGKAFITVTTAIEKGSDLPIELDNQEFKPRFFISSRPFGV